MGSKPGCCGSAPHDQRADLRRTDVETYNDFFSTSHITFSFIGSIRLHLHDHLVLETQVHMNGLRILLLNLRLQLKITYPPGPEFTRSQIHEQRIAQPKHGDFAGIVDVNFGQFGLPCRSSMTLR